MKEEFADYNMTYSIGTQLSRVGRWSHKLPMKFRVWSSSL